MVCKEEFMRFCAFRVDDMKNMEEIVMCLDRHIDQLGQPCKNATEFAAKFIEDFHDGCDNDLKEFCPTMIGKPETGKCILENLPELQKGCLAMVQKSIYLMIRLKEAHSHHAPRDMLPAAPTALDLSTEVFFPGMIEEEWRRDEWDQSGMMPPKMMFHAAFCGSVAGVLAMAAVFLAAKCFCKHRRRCAQGGCSQHISPPAIHVVQGSVAHTGDYKQFA